MNKTKTETNLDRVLAYKEGDRIPYEPKDGPYDPNDAEAARAWLAQADLIRKVKLVRKGKPDQESSLGDQGGSFNS